MTDKNADIGLIGLAVMGQNLVLNMNDHGFRVAVFNRTVSKVDDFLHTSAQNTKVIGCHSLKEFFASLKRPRRVMFMVKAGKPVDELIQECLPFLEKGDIVIDGGNSFYQDTERRCQELKAKGISFLGAGISGGEEGARHGPSIMPGGDPEAWPHVKPIFQAIAAKAKEDGLPCCDWVGSGGAGHFVKMVHNGIEYGDMQLICEAYDLLHRGMGSSVSDLESVFTAWNRGPLHSYLIEITARIFTVKDRDGKPLLDKILDAAQQKGTGKWTAIGALDHDLPVTLIAEAVFARCLSALKEERATASKAYPAHPKPFHGNKKEWIDDLEYALYASKIISYAQGFMLMREAGKKMQWNLNFASIALMWREGCIIRSQFLNNIAAAFRENPKLENLLLAPFFKEAITKADRAWRSSLVRGLESSIPMPCSMAALSFFDGWRSGILPANLLQAQRDFFGAHTYERVDQPRGTYFHTDWTGTGGKVTSTSYSV